MIRTGTWSFAFCATCFAAGVATQSADADSIGMDFTGLGLGAATGGYTINYFDHDANGGLGGMTSKSIGGAGQMKFDITSSYGPYAAGDSVTLFCTDVYDWVHGSPAAYDVVSLAAAPNSPTDGPAGGMGAVHASLINHLYSNYYSMSGNDDVHASAFQLAAWELGNESLTHAATAAGFSISNSGGGDQFFVNGTPNAGGSLKQQALALANSWLAQITTDWNGGLGTLDEDFSLAGAVLESYQDMIIIIPLPKAIWMMALGLPAVLVLRRFKSAVVT